MSLLRKLGLAYLAAVLLVLGFHVAAGDSLIFASDIVSLVIYAGVFSLLLASVLFAASLLFALLPVQAVRKAHVLVIAALCAGLLAAFLAFAGAFLKERIQIGVLLAPYLGFDLLNQIKSTLIQSLPGIALLGVGAVLFFRKPLFAFCWDIRPRLERLAMAVLLGAILLVPGLYGVQLLSRAPANAHGETQRHLILLVLDALPANFLRLYDGSMEPTALDEVLREGRVFTHVRTIAPYTNAYFGTLYSGRLDAKAGRRNLMSRLQSAGVEARWMSYHRNGFPDGSKAQLNAYNGLRSHFLTPKTAWIPELLGLPYHLDLNGSYIANAYFHKLFGAVALDGLVDYRAAFRTTLLPQVRAIQAKADRSFLIFHVGHYLFDIDGPTIPGPQSGDTVSIPDRMAAIHRNDYRYAPADEDLAASMRDIERKYAEAVGQQLRAFLQELRTGNFKSTAVIMTADHGTIFAKGRFWYGYHPNEEVLRVPFAVFNAGEPGVDERLFETRDITATILGYFGLAQDNAEEPAFSVLGQEAGREWVGSLTQRSDKHREWYLALYHRTGFKYLVNLHPEASDSAKRFRVDGYGEESVDGRTDLDAAFPDLARDFMKQFGLDEKAMRASALRF